MSVPRDHLTVHLPQLTHRTPRHRHLLRARDRHPLVPREEQIQHLLAVSLAPRLGVLEEKLHLLAVLQRQVDHLHRHPVQDLPELVAEEQPREVRLAHVELGTLLLVVGVQRLAHALPAGSLRHLLHDPLRPWV